MADQGNPVDDMRNIVRGRDRLTGQGYPASPGTVVERSRINGPAGDTSRMRDIDKAYAELPYTVGADRPMRPAPSQQAIGFASVRQALDEVEKRLQQTVLASEEVMRFHARPEPMKEAMQGTLPGDRPDGTVWEDLATRAVLLSRAIESLERNLKITLETLR